MCSTQSIANDITKSCPLNSQVLRADYQIFNQQQKSSKQFSLWRNERAVAHQYHGAELVELWQLNAKQRVSLTRLFTHADRGIEYHSDDINFRPSWPQKYQLVGADKLAKYQKISEQGQGCQKEQTYAMKTSVSTVELTWLPELALVKKLVVKKGDTIHKSWQLSGLETSPSKVLAKFKQWQHFDMTDFADIGDNEADPFLAKMINMGFSDVNVAQHGHHHAH